LNLHSFSPSQYFEFLSLEAEMAIAMARNGGIGIIHRFLSIEEQVTSILPFNKLFVCELFQDKKTKQLKIHFY
jgi:hypothetical protein